MAQSENPATTLVGALIENQGGLDGIIAKFKNGGLADIVQSWISTGKNLPVSAEQIKNALGPDVLEKIAQKTGMDMSTLSAKLSQFLPDVVDKLSPDGKLPESGEPVSRLLGMVKSVFGKSEGAHA